MFSKAKPSVLEARFCISTIMKLILAKKGAMTQFFGSDGKVQPVTEICVGTNRVVSIKTKEKDGYEALQLGLGEKKHASKALRGQVRGLAFIREDSSFQHLKEVRTDVTSVSRGDETDISMFTIGERVDAIGWSKGRGYTGVVKRHGFHGQKASHGHKDQERMPGSIGAGGVQHVFKGKRMAGRMGNEQTTVKNLEIIRIDTDTQRLYVKGAVPGWRNGLVMLRSAGSMAFKKATSAHQGDAPSLQEAAVDVKNDVVESEN